MKLIIGLGNPGSRYINTRHNLGFKVTSELAERYGADLKKRLFGRAREAQLKARGEKIILLQPLTFMNLSGGCVKGYADKLKIDTDNTLIVCDDINLNLGHIRIRKEGSSGGHNGLESIIESLGTEDFPRLRIGIKTKEAPQDLAEYVLSDFDKDEIAQAKEVVIRGADACECWIRRGIDEAMNLYNK